jgi:hypothetical protein
MTRRAASAVLSLGLEVLAGEIDEALGAERRRVSTRVLDRVVVIDAGLELVGTGRVPESPPHADEQHNRCDHCPYPIAEMS